MSSTPLLDAVISSLSGRGIAPRSFSHFMTTASYVCRRRFPLPRRCLQRSCVAEMRSLRVRAVRLDGIRRAHQRPQRDAPFQGQGRPLHRQQPIGCRCEQRGRAGDVAIEVIPPFVPDDELAVAPGPAPGFLPESEFILRRGTRSHEGGWRCSSRHMPDCRGGPRSS